VRQYDTKRLLLPNCIPCFMRFMLYTVCKTLRLSVFNKELFDWYLVEQCCYRRTISPFCQPTRVTADITL